eukprot:TRINITY_DN0_c1065_g1_i2.p1 TRINITY_DN0_c1065_g1~~TRINITY_DN0_c1065_g1_i2.p1  ORF type:complete len:154 (+),score=45.35 TRINITY_DN0_c1065_g1_i2:37-498(+)
MGILAQGLRIAPPEAPATGYMFGKGVYFADMFKKSFGYTHDYCRVPTARGSKPASRLMLLCEVALGEMYEKTQPEYVTRLPGNFKSTKGLGSQGPNFKKNIVLSNGCTVPIGPIIEYKNPGERLALSHNEYIVYDTTQIKIRYLIQCKEGNEF